MTIERLLQIAIDAGASDLHISAEMPPAIRVDGELKFLKEEPVFSAKATETLLFDCMNAETKKHLEEELDVDFALYSKKLGRFRVNIFYQVQGLAASFRVIPQKIPTIEELELPDIVKQLTELPHGLVLVTGPTGSGKSTTLAAMIDSINQKKALHIITVEDPIEFLYENKKSLINQRELGQSTRSFAHAIRATLREDPDIVLVGEMRDLDTIRLALTAAETGHLVFATLHTSSAPESINRIIDVFPGDERPLVRSMLSESLQAVLSQTLLKRPKKGRIAAMEIMLCNPAIRNLIREDKIAQMYSVIQTGASHGMQTMEQHIQKLRGQKLIDE